VKAALTASLRLAVASESVSRLPEVTAADTRYSPRRPRTEFSGRTGKKAEYPSDRLLVFRTEKGEIVTVVTKGSTPSQRKVQ
jgi:hypothetical protein